MNIIDIILIIPLVWFTVKGFRKGLVIEVAGLLGLVLGIYGAIKFSPLISTYLEDYISVDGEWVTIISFVVGFILILLAIRLIAKTIEKLLDITALSGVNKLLGAAFGLLKIGVIVGLLVYVFDVANKRFQIISEEQKEDTKIYQFFSDNLPEYVPVIKDFLKNNNLENQIQPLDSLIQNSGNSR